MIGQVFSKWTVIDGPVSLKKANGSTTLYWLCRCECGREAHVVGSTLKNGSSKECGCSKRRSDTRPKFRHGMTRTPTYESWQAMLRRCTQPKNVRYLQYGGRGIAVCDRWRVFDNFLTDMGVRPDGMTLDRIDPNGNYEPSNCRWATASTQRTNQRPRANTPTFEGKPILEWARELGVKYNTLYARWKRTGTVYGGA